MAYFDDTERKVVLRIVYDGPAEAGKTTNLRQLCHFFTPRRRSEMVVPEEEKGRTLFFDWLRVDGGVIAGHGVRCQLLTVPGQKELRHRREHLLRLADAVVLVCDSRPQGIEEAKALLAELRELAPLPLVVQANKQDLEGAATPEDVVARLATGDEIPVMPASAHDGHGVRETLVIGIRHAASRTQDIIFASGLEALDSDPCDAEELHRQMVELGPPAAQPEGEPESAGTVAEAEATVAPVEFSMPESKSESERETERAPGSEAMTEREDHTAEVRFEPPSPLADVQAGSIWPAAPGRSLLRSLEGTSRVRREDLEAQKGAADGSAKSDVFIYECGEFCLKTSARRRFETISEARANLLMLARQKSQLGDLLPPNTVLSIQEDARGAHWLWTVTPWLETLRSRMTAGDANDDVELLTDGLVKFADIAVEALALAVRKELVLDVHPNNFAIAPRAICYIDDDIGSGTLIPTIAQTLLQRVDEYCHRPSAVQRYLGKLEDRIGDRLTREEAEKLDFANLIADARPRSPLAQAAQSRLRGAVSRCRSTAAMTI